MKLSMLLLAKYLDKYSPELHIVKDELSIRGIRFLSDQRSRYALDYVYIGEAFGYIQDPRYRDAVILVCGENEVICHSSDTEALINDILSAFDYYGSLEERMRIAAAEHQSLEIMLDAASGILDSPILVFDMEGKLIRAVHADKLPEQMWSSIQQHATLGFETFAQVLIDEEGKIWHDITDSPRLLRPAGNHSESAVSMYLNYEEERVGFVMIFPISENEAQLGQYCEGMFAEHFCRAREFTDRSSVYLSSNQIFKQLLSGETLSEPAAKRFGKEISADSSILLVLRSNGTRNYTIHHLMMDEVKAIGMKCAICEYQSTVAILIRQKEEEQLLALLQRKKWFRNLSVGISMPLYGICELQIAYEQASLAMTARETSGIRRCQDYAPDFLLRLLRENELAFHLRHPAIEILQRYDDAGHTDLLHTLSAYLQHNCSQNLTAEALHIHLNSLKYRLRRIAELTDIDFRDSDELFYLQLSLKILER